MMLDEAVTGGNKYAEIPMDDLKAFVNDFPALLWRIEITRSRIEFLNDYSIDKLGDDTRLFLKNIKFRNKILLDEDAHLLEGFMESVKEGVTASTVFRVHNREGGVVWLKLTGATNSRDPRYYYGYLLDVTDTVRVIRSIVDKDVELQIMIEDSDTPVLLVDVDDGSVLKANGKMADLFGRSCKELEKGVFCDLLTRSMNKVALRMCEEVPFSRKWIGKLEYLTAKGVVVAETVVRYVVYDGRKFLRVALLNPELVQQAVDTVGLSEPGSDFFLAKAMEGVDDIGEIMHLALESHMIDGKYDGIMFSDIQKRRNKVVVYGAGEPFETMPQGEVFSYKGTIAEDIERYGLDHLVVDDTQDSIKPIDWALFIPRGIRSYFAKPYYVRGALRTVLIICSTEPSRFSGRGEGAFDSLFEPMANAAKAWRRQKRQGG